MLQRRSLASAIVAVALAFAVAVTPAARASGPGPPPPAHELYAGATVVFVGKVESIGARTAEVRVLETLKGTPPVNAAGTVTVGPLFEEECNVQSEEKRRKLYAAGDRILVAAVAIDGACAVYGNRFGKQDLGDDASVARAVALAREMMRIVALRDATARRAAMVATLVSPDPAFADAAEWFQFTELDTPEKSAPHAAGLTAALSAPVPLARRVALLALGGVAAPEAWERVVALTADPDPKTADAAVAAVASYSRDEAVATIERAAAQPGGRELLFHLAASPQPLARRRIHERIAAGDAADRLLAYKVLGRRIARTGATDDDVADLLAFVRSDAAAAGEAWEMEEPLRVTRSMAVARALVDIVRDEKSDSVRRFVAYWVLSGWARPGGVRAALDLLRKEEAVFIRRLDAGEPRCLLVDILRSVHTPSAREAIARAAATNPDERTRRDATAALERW